MQLAVWTYEGPPHVGAMRVATAMEKLHYVLHAPQGDTYADLLFTMIERRAKRPPVTYTTFEARDLGKDTAQIFQDAAREAVARFNPQAIIVGASCTAELIQDDPAGLSEAMGLPVPVIPLELPSYQRKENWGAAETFYQIVRTLADKSVVRAPREGRPARANILGPTALGFRHRDDLVEIRKILGALGVEINLVAPLGAPRMTLPGSALPISTSSCIPKSQMRPPAGSKRLSISPLCGPSLSAWEQPAPSSPTSPSWQVQIPRLPSATPLPGCRGGHGRSIRPT